MKLRIFLVLMVFMSGAYAQVGVGTTSPNASAELHVSSTNKGFLIPRLSNAQMLAVVTPANGLLIYNLDKKQFYYYNSAISQWTPSHISAHGVVSDADGDTKIDVDFAGDGSDNKIHLYANADGNKTLNGLADRAAIMDSTSFALTGTLAYRIEAAPVLSNNATNIAVGNRSSVITNMTGTQNTAVGVQAGNAITSGSGNTVIGASAGQYVTTGSNNTFVGASAGKGVLAAPLTGSDNVAIGSGAGVLLQSTANGNTIVGYGAGADLTTGKGNIFIGNATGAGIATGDSNIVIGNGLSFASALTTRKLSIGGVVTSDSAYHLAGNITFLNAYTFPHVSGLQDQTLVVSDDNKKLIWADKTVAGQSAMTVTGAATDMKPYSRLVAANTYRQQPNEVYYIPVVAMSNGSISKITTFLVSTTGTTTITAALFESTATAGTYNIATKSGYKFRGSTTTTNTSGYITIDFFNNDNNGDLLPDQQFFDVTVGKKYVIALYSNRTSTWFFENQDADNKGAKPSDGTIPDTKVGLTFGADLIWARAH